MQLLIIQREVTNEKLIITALLTASTSSAFAIDHMLINGKKITMEDTRSTLTQKLGKPSSNGKGYNEWKLGSTQVYAAYNQYGLQKLSAITTGNTSSLVAVVNDKRIQLKKDTFNNVKAKLKRGCTDIQELRYADQYTFSTRIGAEGEYNAVFEAEGKTDPVYSITFTYEDGEYNQGCNY